MADSAANKAPQPEASFQEPLEFLEPFRVEGQAFTGLVAHMDRFLDLPDDGATIRSFVAEHALSETEQSAHIKLLRSTLDIRQDKANAKSYIHYYPELDASIEYLKFRLTLGIMEPAIQIALDNTNLGHTRVRTHRTLVAAGMVHDWVQEQFYDKDTAAMAPGLLQMEMEGHLKQHFNGVYKDSDETETIGVLRSGIALPPIDTAGDKVRHFDILDFTKRVLYSNGQELISVDELEEILEENAAAALKQRTSSNPGVRTTSAEPLSEADAARVRDQVMQRVCADLGGIIPEFKGLVERPIDLRRPVLARDKLLPAGQLAGRAEALVVAQRLLALITVRPKPKDPKSPQEVRVLVKERLTELVDHYARPGLPIDVILMLADEVYRKRYGEEPTHRDFSDNDDRHDLADAMY